MSVPGNWRIKIPRYRFIGKRCVCGRVWFPPRDRCSCGSKNLENWILPRYGEIISWTVIHTSPEGFEPPYTIALVDFDGVLLTGQVINHKNENLIGKKVRVVFRRLYETSNGLIVYGYKFNVV
jgi:uncharacterized OB-fold protein